MNHSLETHHSGSSMLPSRRSRWNDLWTFLSSYSDYRVVLYEDLCEQPESGFRELYDFAGLVWTDRISEHVLSHSNAGESFGDGRYEIQKESRQVADRWRQQIPPEALGEMRETYLAYETGYYGEETW